MSEAAIAPGTIQMPPGEWIPNIEQMTDSAAGLLAVMGRALDDWGLGGPFTRRAWSHGDTIPLFRPEGEPPSQLLVGFSKLHLGEAGKEQFTYASGVLGAYAHFTGVFVCEVYCPWPTVRGGLAAVLASDEERMKSAALLNRCGWVVWSALRSLAMGGRGAVIVTPPVTPIQQDRIMVGPMLPKNPDGGLAGWTINVQLQYS